MNWKITLSQGSGSLSAGGVGAEVQPLQAGRRVGMQAEDPLARAADPAAVQAQSVVVPLIVRCAEVEEGEDHVGIVIARAAAPRDHGEQATGHLPRVGQQVDLAADASGVHRDQLPDRDHAPISCPRPGRAVGQGRRRPRIGQVMPDDRVGMPQGAG
jgi:hypothetical protein